MTRPPPPMPPQKGGERSSLVAHLSAVAVSHVRIPVTCKNDKAASAAAVATAVTVAAAAAGKKSQRRYQKKSIWLDLKHNVKMSKMGVATSRLCRGEQGLLKK